MYKKKEYHHFGNEYRVNPHALIYHQGIYLLLAVPVKDSRVRVYRVDRMENLEISHADRTQKEIMEKSILKNTHMACLVYTLGDFMM